MLPEQSLLICTSPRSGSNWLCELIGSTGQFGKPDEYFSISSDRFYERQLGRGSIGRYPVVFDYILRLGMTPNRRFASKIFRTQLDELETYFHACGEFVGRDALSILHDQLPNLRVLRLGREDRLRQAISHYRALRTNIWWRHKHIPVPQDADCPFDYQRIRELLVMLEEWEADWDRLLGALDVPRLTIRYGDMRADLPGVLSTVAAFLDIGFEPAPAGDEPGFTVQADATTDAWVRRFIAEDDGRTSRLLGRDLASELAPAPDRLPRVPAWRTEPVPACPAINRLTGADDAAPVYIQPDFLGRDDCATLTDCLRRNRHLYPRLPGKPFDDRFLWLATLPAGEEASRSIIRAARRQLVGTLATLFGLERPLYPETTQLVVWRAGQDQRPHADNANPDGRPHPTAHRDFATIVYLNDDFTGGALYFPKLGITLAPQTGTMVAFPGGLSHLHGVLPVVDGERHTMASWFTHDAARSDRSELQAA